MRLQIKHSDVERELVERLTRAFESGDVAGIVALLTDDVKFVMPPDEYDGRIAAGEFLKLLASTLWQHRGPRLIARVPTVSPRSASTSGIRPPRRCAQWACWRSRSRVIEFAP